MEYLQYALVTLLLCLAAKDVGGGLVCFNLQLEEINGEIQQKIDQRRNEIKGEVFRCIGKFDQCVEGPIDFIW